MDDQSPALAALRELLDAERSSAEALKVRVSALEKEAGERRRSEDSLRQQSEIFRIALSHTPDFTYLLDVEGRFIYTNQGLLSLWQKTLDEVVGKNFFDLDYPIELATTLHRQIQEVVDARAIVRDETPYTGASGGVGFYEYIFVPVLGADGGVIAIAGSTRDITARKRMESALRESERLFNAAFSEAPVGMILMSPDGEFIEANRWFLKMLGYSREEIASRTSDPITHPDDIEATHAFGEAFRQRRQSSGVIEKRYIRKDGSLVWARIAGSMRYDQQGEATQFIAIIEDITQQKRAEEALRASQERLQLIFAQAPVAVCVLRGPELVFELVNAHYQEFFPGRILLSRPLLEAVPEVGAEIRQILNGVLTTGVPFAAEEFKIPLDRDDDGVIEDYWFTFVYQPLRDAVGKVEGIVVVAVDVTSHMRARQGLERANRNLEEFAYVASHDLQEPLRMVKIYAQLLSQNIGKKSEEQLRSHAAHVEEGALRMERLIRDLLEYSRTAHSGDEPEMFESADLNVALEYALKAVDTRVSECRAVVTKCSLPIVAGNATQLAHVFQNLLTNALKYCKPDQCPRIEIKAVKKELQWVVSVADNGIGFNPEYAERIFALFKRLHGRDKYDGTGLGLAICRRIVERYGGRIWAESQEGVGSTFYFALPQPASTSPNPGP